LSTRQDDRAELRSAVKTACPVVGKVFPDVPYPLCHFHDRLEAGRHTDRADRHAKKELEKGVRAVRGIERRTEGRTDPEAEVIRGVLLGGSERPDGRRPAAAGGLGVETPRSAIGASLDRVEGKRGSRPNSGRGRGAIERGLEATAGLWPPVRAGFGWVHQAAHLLGLEEAPD
jgi:hypothetical protein